MAVSTKTRILIWSRAANRCAICQRELFMDETSTDDPSLVGDVAHIVAEKPGGPRGESARTPEQRDLYSNLVLLCKEHHKLVDDNEEEYPVERLHQIKDDHVQWVRERLEGFDAEKQRAIEVFATYVQEWTDRASLTTWEAWSSHMLGSGQPKMSVEDDQRLTALSDWLFTRIWPDEIASLRSAFENFRRVLSDLLRIFHDHSEQQGEWFDTEKFYRRGQPGSEAEQRLSREFDFHVDLVFDLTVELTRAANYVCDKVRETLDPAFRLEEGTIVAQSGPDMMLNFKRHRVAYHGDERTDQPYPGLEEFKVIRKHRDCHWGEGTSIDDPDCRCTGDDEG